MEKSFAFSGAFIHYSVHGEGTNVILLHGFGEDSSIWHNQIQSLQSHCRVIVPDIPGSGKSGLIDKPLVAMDDYAEVIYALLQQEKIQQCILIGHSMGGYITLAFAGRFPKMLKGFGWVHSTAFEDSEEKKLVRQRGIEIIKEYGSFSFLKNTIPNLFSEKSKKTNPELATQLTENAYSFTKDALIQYYNAMIVRPDRTHVLKASAVPVLMIAGTEDQAVPLPDALKQAAMPDVCYFHVPNEVGHMGMIENPEDVNNKLLAFIQDCSQTHAT